MKRVITTVIAVCSVFLVSCEMYTYNTYESAYVYTRPVSTCRTIIYTPVTRYDYKCINGVRYRVPMYTTYHRRPDLERCYSW